MEGTRRDEWTRTRQARRLVALGIYFLAVALLWDSQVLYPLRLFVVFLHEVSHGLAAVATGGEIVEIAVTQEEGGYCRCPGGNAFVTLSAGYVGSVAWGALLLRAADAGDLLTRIVLGATGAAVALLTLTFVEGEFGVYFGVAFGGGLAAGAILLGARARAAVLFVVGATSCLYAILDIKTDVLDRPGGNSDARMLAEITGVPASVWGFVWILASLAALALLLRLRRG